ncbi:MAG TPA: hypothetical protein VKC64_14365 [Burkholderiales bacterium]|nr:hypothetical protein [Burkholderiales bacterium]
MRNAVIWILLSVLPFQALTAVYLDLRGPAHFHLDDDEVHEPGHGRTHAHSQLERHHHPAGDPTVVTAEDDAALESHALEEGTSGWSATMCAAAVSAGASLDLPKMADGAILNRERLPQTRFLGRLERPPRIPDRI